MAGQDPSSNRVDVWFVDLDDGGDQRPLIELLSSDETARAGRFHLPIHRRRFVAGRAALRRVLSAEKGGDPRALQIS
jgi:4'-phosphopantetheinyl transferase